MSKLSDIPAEYLGKAAKMVLAQTDVMHQDQETLLRDQRNRLREHQRKLLGLGDSPQEGDEMRIVADNITIQQPQPQPAPVPPVARGLGTLAKIAIATGLLGSGGAAAVAGKYIVDRLANRPAATTTTTNLTKGLDIEIGSASSLSGQEQ